MTKKLLYFLLVLSLAHSLPLQAQDTLSLKEAITIALKNNYDIRLVNNQVQIARNNVNAGNAGMLPSLAGTYSDGGSRQNTVQTPATGAERRTNGARSTSMSYGAALDWTVFDGLQMFAGYERLKELRKQGEVNARSTVLSTISAVINAYYGVARQQQLVKATDSALEISRLRVSIASSKLQIGRGSKLDVLSARVDYNADTTLYLQQKNELQTARITLNQVMARDLNMVFATDEKIEISNDMQLAALQQQTEQLNPNLQNALISQRIAALNLKQVKGQRYPVVALNSGYAFSKSTSPTGFNQKFRASGFTYGLTANMNLFNGFLQRQNERNARIEISSAAVSLEKTRQDVGSLLLTAFRNYQTSLDLLKVETGNTALARENLEITFEKYRLGSISPVELREAQRNSINAVIRYLDAKYQAKLTEINLKEISGTLNVE